MKQTPAVSKAVSGRAIGALFFAGFGAIWMTNGLAALHRLNPVSFAAVVGIVTALAAAAIRLLRLSAGNHTATPTAEEIQAEFEIKRVFGRVNTIQWAAIVAAIVLLNLIQKVEYLAPVVTFIVGMHLFPLATVFRYPAHNLTGTLLVLWAIVNTALFAPQSMPSIAALGTGMILLGSAGYATWSATRAAKAMATIPNLQTRSA